MWDLNYMAICQLAEHPPHINGNPSVYASWFLRLEVEQMDKDNSNLPLDNDKWHAYFMKMKKLSYGTRGMLGRNQYMERIRPLKQEVWGHVQPL